MKKNKTNADSFTRRAFLRLAGASALSMTVPLPFGSGHPCAAADTNFSSVLARFAVISDTHIAVPYNSYTYDSPYVNSEPGIRLHKESAFILKQIVAEINIRDDLDFVLHCGDLTKDSERPNHDAFIDIMGGCTIPVYVHPGNHDTLHPSSHVPADAELVPASMFPELYEDFGYKNSSMPYYSAEPVPGLLLIALDSSVQGSDGGLIDKTQMAWLSQQLESAQGTGKEIIVSVHHTVMASTPVEDNPLLGSLLDFMHVGNSAQLRSLLGRYGVKYVFGGHVHIQDINYCDGLFGIITGSTITHPVPYRIVTMGETSGGDTAFSVESKYVGAFFGDDEVQSQTHLYSYSEKMLIEGLTDLLVEVLTHPDLGPLVFSPADAEIIGARAGRWYSAFSRGDEALYTSLDALVEGTTLGKRDVRMKSLSSLVNQFIDAGMQDNTFSFTWPSAGNMTVYALKEVADAETHVAMLSDAVLSPDYTQARFSLRMAGYSISRTRAYLDAYKKLTGTPGPGFGLLELASRSYDALKKSLQFPFDPGTRLPARRAAHLLEVLGR